MSQHQPKRANRGAIGFIRIGVHGKTQSATVTLKVPELTAQEMAMVASHLDHDARAIAKGLPKFAVIGPDLVEAVLNGNNGAVAVYGNLLLDEAGEDYVAFIECSGHMKSWNVVKGLKPKAFEKWFHKVMPKIADEVTAAMIAGRMPDTSKIPAILAGGA